MTQELQNLSSEQRRELLKKLLAERGVGFRPLPLTLRAIWLYQQLRPDSTAYNEGLSFRVRGALDVALLEHSLAALLARHPILGATFHDLPDGPAMLLNKQPPTSLRVHEVPDMELDALRPELRAATMQRIDLRQGPLFRAELYRGVKGGDVLLVVGHHLVLDLWSLQIMMKDWLAEYHARIRGVPANLPNVAGYTDFIAWQSELLRGPRGAELHAYWLERLRGIQPQLELPAEVPQGAPMGAARHEFAIDAHTVARLRALAQQQGTTLFVLLQSAFFALLHRYSGQDDIVVGSPMSGRTSPEFNLSVGCFMNPVCLRAQFTPNMTFLELLQQVQRATIEALDHQEYPASLLLSDLKVARTADRSPLYSAMFMWEQLTGPADVVQDYTPQLTLEPIAYEQDMPKADFGLAMREEGEGMHGLVHYRTDLFDAGSIARLAKSLAVLLNALARAPDRPLAHLPISSDAEHRKLLRLGRAAPPLATESWELIHDPFEQRARERPAAVAVISGDARITYGELDARANELASHLLDAGLAPAQLVGLYGERGIDLLVGLLAILKAGGSYLPLGRELPAQRLQFMLQDARIERIVATRASAQAARELAPHAVVVAPLSSAGTPAPTPIRRNGPDARAYVLYTSGSTGQPKGVEVEHGSAVSLLQAMMLDPGISERDVMLSVSGFGFDISIVELFLPLSVGATVVLPPVEVVRDPVRMVALLESSGATVMQATPSYWHLIIAAGWSGTAHFRAWAGGEALSRELVAQILDRAADLWNGYGITETTIYSTGWHAQREAATVPIGKPLSNTDIYVLDAELQPVPIGVKGQIFIGGAGLSRGYLHRDDLTAARFKTVELEPGQPVRLYASGDVGRFLADGSIVYCGRSDHQVKVHGQRIELEEISAALEGHPAVAAAVVVLATVRAQPSLVAYLARRADGAPDDEALISSVKVYLRGILPLAMLPANYVVLDALPLSPSGKVDRRALPAPLDPSDTPIVRRPLQGDTQQVLARCWREVLGIAEVGPDDNFFELGGSSLSAMKVAAQAAKLGLSFVPDAIFVNQTIEELALAIDKGHAPRRPEHRPGESAFFPRKAPATTR